MSNTENLYHSNRTLDGVATIEETIKKSRFIAHATRADTVDQAHQFLEKTRCNDATHNCWAYKIGRLYRFSDDGEPGGSAGRPIYAAIEHHDLDHVVVLVIRYFGGIKLGAGGLARAYGGVASSCLQKARIHIVHRYVNLLLDAPFSATGAIYSVLDFYPEIEKLADNYTDIGLSYTLQMPESLLNDFSERIKDASAGQASLKILSIDYF